VLPVSDVVPRRTRPWVTLALVAAQGVAIAVTAGADADALAALYERVGLQSSWSWRTAIASPFLPHGWLHALVSASALWIAARPLEDRLGHARFILVYALLCLAAAASHVATAPGSTPPVVGAGGALAGLAGGYLVLFPRSRVVLLVPALPVHVVEVPAPVFLGCWFVLEALAAIARATAVPPTGALTLWAYLAGFGAGAGALWVARRRERDDPAWWDTVTSRRSAGGRRAKPAKARS
jgi:membrane associated rhomboid family serine protease